jgi:hypothetical protein
MDSTFYSQTILPWFLGLFAAFIGFVGKGIIDYFWLKAPRLTVRATLLPTITNPPRNRYRNYQYNIEIEIQNHSKNEAYGLEVISITMPTGLFIDPGTISDKYDHVVSDTVSAQIFAKCSITLPVEESNATKDARGRINDFGNKIKIKFSYKNQLGKPYTRIREVEFHKNLTIVHSTIIKSFSPANK